MWMWWGLIRHCFFGEHVSKFRCITHFLAMKVVCEGIANMFSNRRMVRERKEWRHSKEASSSQKQLWQFWHLGLEISGRVYIWLWLWRQERVRFRDSYLTAAMVCRSCSLTPPPTQCRPEHTHTNIDTYTHMCLQIYIHTHIHTYTYIHTYTCIRIYTYTHVHISKNVHMCTHIHMYVKNTSNLLPFLSTNGFHSHHHKFTWTFPAWFLPSFPPPWLFSLPFASG